jgi:two-component sensor histidine kinase
VGLVDLIKTALEPFGVANGMSERFVISGENTRVPPKVALALGIAFHELATNAVKYGAFSNESGSVHIACTTEPTPEGARLVLRWQETDGPVVTPPSRKGFGSRVIERGLALELEGAVNLDYRPEGVVCTINFPAPKGAGNG